MSKIINIKLTKAGAGLGPFNIYTQYRDVIAMDISRKELIKGVVFKVENNIESIILLSTGRCRSEKIINLDSYTTYDFADTPFKQTGTGCIWAHLTEIDNYHSFYGISEPYILEYPFAYQFQDEILQNVKDYTKAFEYLPHNKGVFSQNTRIETNDKWFNKAILYNGQQSSGVLELVPKPKNNLSTYNKYPILTGTSKIIVYTKYDNFYQYNTFWAIQKDSQVPMFLTSCDSLSVDKVANQDNMDYASRSFKKATLRAKDLKVRQILDNSNTTHLVSQFILTPSQISY